MAFKFAPGLILLSYLLGGHRLSLCLMADYSRNITAFFIFRTHPASENPAAQSSGSSAFSPYPCPATARSVFGPGNP